MKWVQREFPLLQEVHHFPLSQSLWRLIYCLKILGIMLNVLLNNLKSVESGPGVFLSSSVYKAALISALVKSSSGSSSNVMSSLLLLGYTVVRNICDVTCQRFFCLDAKLGGCSSMILSGMKSLSVYIFVWSQTGMNQIFTVLHFL